MSTVLLDIPASDVMIDDQFFVDDMRAVCDSVARTRLPDGEYITIQGRFLDEGSNSTLAELIVGNAMPLEVWRERERVTIPGDQLQRWPKINDKEKNQ